MTEGVGEAKVEAEDQVKIVLAEMRKKIDDLPQQKEHRRNNQEMESPTCIFRLPDELKKKFQNKYQVPQIVSIGPYHKKLDTLKEMDDNKWLYVRSFVTNNMSKTYRDAMDRFELYNIPLSIRFHIYSQLRQFKSSAAAKENSRDLDVYIKSITDIQEKAKNCYSEGVGSIGTNEFVAMMIRDGCFILELFLRFNDWREFEQADPILKKLRVSSALYNDLLLLENQIPFLVLTELFNASLSENLRKYSEQILINLALRFFSMVMRMPQEAVEWYCYENYDKKLPFHLLDLIRSSFTTPLKKLPRENIPCFLRLLCAGNGRVNPDNRCTRTIPCFSKLFRAGIEVKPCNAESFLAVKFKSGVIHMPSITIDDSMGSFLVNCVAFEQSQPKISKYFMRYATFLDCLSNTKEDIDLLYERKVIEHGFESDDQLATFINALGKDLLFGFDNAYLSEDDFNNLSKMFNEVNAYYKSGIRWKWADFKREYFHKPWLLISAFVALVYLLLTFGQTFISGYAYVHPNSKQ